MQWLALGGRYTQDEFWSQTPHSLALEMDAAERRLAREHNERAWLVYYTAALQRAKRLPSFRSMMARPTSKERGTQILNLVRWVQATGGKVIRK